MMLTTTTVSLLDNFTKASLFTKYDLKEKSGLFFIFTPLFR